MSDAIKLKLDMDTSRLDHFLANYVSRAEDEIERAQGLTATDLEAVARAEIETSSHSGRHYKHHGGEYVASSPKHPPADQTGELARDTKGYVLNRFIAILASPNPIARALEFGTRHLVRRPFMYPARRIVLPRAKKRLRQAVNAVAKELVGGG